MSEVEGKATGWSAWFTDGKWVIEQKKKAAPKKTAAKKASAKKSTKASANADD